jgi:hypothetical protein
MRKTDLQRLKEGLAQIYGEDNIITKNQIHGLTYDITLREPLIIIEYYGIQHFCDLSTLKAEYDFNQIQIEDKRKKKYCARHNIPLLIFTSGEKNFLTPQYIKYRIEYQLGTYGWFGEKEFLS